MAAALNKYAIRKTSQRDFAKKWGSHLLRPVSVRWTGKGSQVFQMALATRGPAANETDSPLSGGLSAYKTNHGAKGVLGCTITTRSGASVWFQAGPQRRCALQAGEVQANGEALMAMKKNGALSGIVLGARSVTVAGKAYALAATDAEFTLDAKGRFTSRAIRRPIDTVRITPAQKVFVDTLELAFDIPNRETRDIEFRYTLDGSDPTLGSPRYTKPFTINQTCMVKVRPFRKGLTRTPWNFPGVDAGKTMTAIFRKVDYEPARKITGLAPGLQLEYLEGDWPDLFMNAGDSDVIAVLKKTHTAGLLKPKEIAAVRGTDRAYAIRYTGALDIPKDGVYVFHAPRHLFDVTMDAGFDLRIRVDGKEWFPAPGLHAQNTWSVALKKGLHNFQAAFVDFRYKTFKSEYWLPWQEEEVWRGIPVLQISGPGMKKQALPESWIKRQGK